MEKINLIRNWNS